MVSKKTVQEKYINEHLFGNPPDSSACALCYGTHIMPYIKAKRLIGELCKCFDNSQKALMNLPMRHSEKYSVWSSLNHGTKPPRSIGPAPASMLDEEDIQIAKDAKLALENGTELIDFCDGDKHRVLEVELKLKEYMRIERSITEHEAKIKKFEPTPEEAQMFTSHHDAKRHAEKHNKDILLKENELKRRIDAVEAAELVCATPPPSHSELHENIQNWIELTKDEQSPSLFIYGPDGMANSSLASCALFHAIVLHGVVGEFIACSDIVYDKKSESTVDFRDRDAARLKSKWEKVRTTLKKSPVLIIDDLCGQKATEATTSLYKEIIKLRDASGHATIYTSNHWRDGGEDGITLGKKLGAVAAKKIFACLPVYLSGGIEKDAVTPTPTPDAAVIRTGSRSVNMDDVKNFHTTGIQEGETTSPFFIAQNPVFQIVSNQERAKLTDDEGRDLPLPIRTYKDTWIPGDELTLHGPALDQDDCVLLLALMEILHDTHRLGHKGLEFRCTYAELRRKMGIKTDSSKANAAIMRRLKRLQTARVWYQRNKKDMYLGGFVDYVEPISFANSSELFIELNPAIIAFYQNPSFFKVQLGVLQKLSYVGKKLYFFLASLEEEYAEIPYTTILKLFGQDVVSRRFLQNLKETFEELKSAGLQSQYASFGKKSLKNCGHFPISLPAQAPQLTVLSEDEVTLDSNHT